MTINIRNNKNAEALITITLCNQSVIDLLKLLSSSQSNLTSTLACDIYKQLNAEYRIKHAEVISVNPELNKIATLMGGQVDDFIKELQVKIRSDNGQENIKTTKVVRLDSYKKEKNRT